MGISLYTGKSFRQEAYDLVFVACGGATPNDTSTNVFTFTQDEPHIHEQQKSLVIATKTQWIFLSIWLKCSLPWSNLKTWEDIGTQGLYASVAVKRVLESG